MSDLFTQNFAHIHIPKTAGMSILNYLGVIHPAHDPVVKTEGYKDVVRTVPHHASIRKFKEIPNEDLITFAVVRNPYDRLLSLWLNHFRAGICNERNFTQWLMKLVEGHVEHSAPQVHYITDSDYGLEPDFFNIKHRYHPQNKVIVDTILRFETLEEDWKKLCEKVKIPYASLLKANVSLGRKHYSYYYDNTAKEIVNYFFRDDLLRFRYVF